MLQNRRKHLAGELEKDEIEQAGERIHDSPDGIDSDLPPSELFEATDWSEYQLKRMREFEKDLAGLAGPSHDHKLEATRLVVEDCLRECYQPVIFCRYIQTAEYLGEQLRQLLAKDFPNVNVQVVHLGGSGRPSPPADRSDGGLETTGARGN